MKFIKNLIKVSYGRARKYLKYLARIVLGNQWIRFIIFRLVMVAAWPLHKILTEKFFPIILYLSQNKKPKIKLSGKFEGSRKLIYFVSGVVAGYKGKTTDQYITLLSTYNVPVMLQREIASIFLRNGRLDLATLAFSFVTPKMQQRKDLPLPKEDIVNYFREAGVAEFLYGKNDRANNYWKLAGLTRKTIYQPAMPRTYRILGSTWFAAIGHVAYIDYYLKGLQLYVGLPYRIVAIDVDYEQLACAEDFLLKFAAFGITLLKEHELEADYDLWAYKNRMPTWSQLSSTEKAGLRDEFWEWEFPQNEILSFPQATDKIQKRWEKLALPPLLSLDALDRAMLEHLLLALGVPHGAWYVCLHVRESGFHGAWNKIYPSMRDGHIDDYMLAINEIVNAGGWVIRMGDPTMKSLPTMSHVVDYAHSLFKSPVGDRLIAANGQFFLGTNSGLNMIPGIYGVPCALTNWVPIGWPLWPKQDLMICKLFRDKESKGFLTVEDIFEQGLAFLQNWADLPHHIELVDNTPEEIRDLTLEMLARFSYSKPPLFDVKNGVEINEGYSKLSIKYGTYSGSQFAQTFVAQHPDVFAVCKDYCITHETIEAEIYG